MLTHRDAYSTATVTCKKLEAKESTCIRVPTELYNSFDSGMSGYQNKPSIKRDEQWFMHRLYKRVKTKKGEIMILTVTRLA